MSIPVEALTFVAMFYIPYLLVEFAYRRWADRRES